MSLNPDCPQIIIDSTPRLEGVLTALLPLDGATLLDRHIRLAKKLGAKKIFILEDADQSVSKSLARLAGDGVNFCLTPPSDAGRALQLSTLHVYREGAPKVIWTLRNAGDLNNAIGEIERSGFFTISKHTLRPLGRIFARWAYEHTSLTGNHLTLARIGFGLLGAWLFYQGDPLAVFLAGLCVLISWFFDLTDGQLARLRNEVSKFGGYLDGVGDGVVDNLYYIAIAMSAYRDYMSETYVWLGFGFLFGKYVFVNSTLLAPQKTHGSPANTSSAGIDPFAGLSRPRWIAKKTFSLLDETDVRIHLLAVTAILNIPVAALVFHVVYFNLRWILNLANTYYKFEIKKETM